MEENEVDWIAAKAWEFLQDKVKDGPLTKHEVDMAYDIFARPRVQRLRLSDFERRQVEDQIMAKLEERAKQMNLEHWGKAGL
ncbi:MAG: hypothetical protein QXM46_01995 [Candidatus Hadarchaeales archaeon]